MKKYNLYLDDTGFNSHEKKSKSLQAEQGTYVGVLVPTDKLEELNGIMEGLADILEEKYGTREFHFTDIYNGKEPFDIMSAEEKLYLLGAFADLLKMYKLKAFVYTSTKREKNYTEEQLDKMIEFMLEKLGIKKSEKSKTLIYAYLKAKFYLSNKGDGYIIESVISDEGLRKAGTELATEGMKFRLNFASSGNEKMLQIADFAAWYITRAKNVYDKMSSKKKISEFDAEVIKIYSRLSGNYVGLAKKWIDLENLENFDYDKIIEECTEKE